MEGDTLSALAFTAINFLDDSQIFSVLSEGFPDASGLGAPLNVLPVVVMTLFWSFLRVKVLTIVALAVSAFDPTASGAVFTVLASSLFELSHLQIYFYY